MINVSRHRQSHHQFDAQFQGGAYVRKDGDRKSFTRKELILLATSGKFVGTFTARHGGHDDVASPQPAIWTLGSLEKQSGHQKFPILYDAKHSMMISGRHIGEDAFVIVDGRRVPGGVRLGDNEQLVVELSTLPPLAS